MRNEVLKIQERQINRYLRLSISKRRDELYLCAMQMIKIIGVLLGFIVTIQLQAQDKPSKYTTDSMKVEGICEMCKTRIEETVNLSKGVKTSSWDKASGMLIVTYKTKKTNMDQIATNLNKVGHDTERSKASQKEYDGLHSCCRYREDAVH